MGSGKNDAVDIDDIERLVELFKQSTWDEMHLEMDGLEIFLSHDPNAQGLTRTSAGGRPDPAETSPPGLGAAPATVAPGLPEQAGAAGVPHGMVAVRAPNLGTFYRAPKPGAPPYVEIGQRVEAHTELCLIEVMKLFTAVRAGVAGVVREIRVEDGHLIEFEQVLVIIEPVA